MDPIIALSGDHDDDEDTRLAALDELTVDIKVDSWYPDAEKEGRTTGVQGARWRGPGPRHDRHRRQA